MEIVLNNKNFLLLSFALSVNIIVAAEQQSFFLTTKDKIKNFIITTQTKFFTECDIRPSPGCIYLKINNIDDCKNFDNNFKKALEKPEDNLIQKNLMRVKGEILEIDNTKFFLIIENDFLIKFTEIIFRDPYLIENSFIHSERQKDILISPYRQALLKTLWWFDELKQSTSDGLYVQLNKVLNLNVQKIDDALKDPSLCLYEAFLQEANTNNLPFVLNVKNSVWLKTIYYYTVYQIRHIFQVINKYYNNKKEFS